jgi:hypothetical protein
VAVSPSDESVMGGTSSEPLFSSCLHHRLQESPTHQLYSYSSSEFLAHLTFCTCLPTVLTLLNVLLATTLPSVASSTDYKIVSYANNYRNCPTSTLAATEVRERQRPHLPLNGSSQLLLATQRPLHRDTFGIEKTKTLNNGTNTLCLYLKHV